MLTHYLNTALRHFRQHKLTTAINVVCLALGLACFILAWGITAYYAAADGYHVRAERIAVMTKKERDVGLTMPQTPWLLGEHLRVDFPQLEATARVQWPQETALVTSDANSDARTNTFAAVSYAEAEFLRIFDLPMIAGSARSALDQPRSAIVSEALALRLFGTREAVGRRMRVSGGAVDVTVTAVVGSIPQPSHLSTERASPLLLHFEAMLSADMDPVPLASQRWNDGVYFTYLVLPKDGSLTLSGLNEQLGQFARRHVPGEGGESLWQFRAHPIADAVPLAIDMLVRADSTGISGAAIVRMLAVLVLLVACLNYANLATAQSAMRSREVALRRIVGAHRLQVTLQHFYEALLLSVTALALALLTVAACAWAFDASILTGLVSMLGASVAGWVLLAATLLGVSLIACAYPALVLARVRPAAALASARTKFGPQFVATLLVGLQFGSASFLLISVSVMIAQSREMQRAVVNATTDPLVVLGNNLRAAGVDRETLKQRLLQQPGSERSQRCASHALGARRQRRSGDHDTGRERGAHPDDL